MFKHLAALSFAAFLLGGQAIADVPVPALSARVTDLTGTLSSGQKAQLEARLADFEQKKGSQVAVLMLPSTQPETIEQYAVRVFETWKLGRAKQSDGVLVIVAKNDRQMRIEVGYGLEGAIPDARAKRIVADTMAPFFKTGNFYGGIDAGINAIFAAIDTEALPAPTSRQTRGAQDASGDYQTLFLILIIGVLIFSRVGTAVMGRFAGSLAAGAGSGLLAWLIAGVLLGAGVGLLTFIVSLLLGASPGRYSHAGVFPSVGGWGGGGFGGGGFGGGGGSSGGGGAWGAGDESAADC